MDPILGQIIMFAGNFAPRGWAFCEGQLLSISANTALFSIIGTTYGGDGRTTFALPDLRGRAPIQAGQGPGLSRISLGERGGTEQVTLSAANMPTHSHSLNVSNADATTSNPQGSFPANSQFQIDRSSPVVKVNSYGGSADTTMSPQTIGAAGGNIPFDNRDPYLGVNYIIALQGVFPSRG